MHKRHETQQLQHGVRRADGKVQLVTSRNSAQERANQLNRLAEQIGAPQVARPVRRHITVVTLTTATPWEG